MTGHHPGGWEYLTIAESDYDRLTDLGREGWELAAVVGSPGAQLLYLKRPELSFRERVTMEQREAYYASRGLKLEKSEGRRGS